MNNKATLTEEQIAEIERKLKNARLDYALQDVDGETNPDLFADMGNLIQALRSEREAHAAETKALERAAGAMIGKVACNIFSQRDVQCQDIECLDCWLSELREVKHDN